VGPEGEALANDLMAGFPNKSLESATRLWDLAQEARKSPAVETLLRDQPPSAFLAKLDTVAGGLEYRDSLQRYLDEYGHRNESFSELSYPTWREDPRFPLLMMKRYLDSPPESAPAAMHARTVARRDARLAEVSARLAGDAEQWAVFQAAMKDAQQRTSLLEDHNFYIDQAGPSATREFCLALGTGLAAAGVIESRNDVFYLRQAEIEAASHGAALDYRALVTERRAARDRWSRVLPPATVGGGEIAMPEPMVQFFGPMRSEPVEAGAFRGVAGSPGVMRGIARLVLTLEDIDRLAPGEILVTYATAPPWTPAFAIAGGIVTDIGGMLAHCAVVAREYGIPAVVGTRVATATIQDGQLITVDGTNGIVRLEE
jgi:pyruvate,water dikinase